MFRHTGHVNSGESAVAWTLVTCGFTVALTGSTAIAFAQNSPNVPPGNLAPSHPGLLLPQPGNTVIGVPSQNIPGARDAKKPAKKLEGESARKQPEVTKEKKTQKPAIDAARTLPSPPAPVSAVNPPIGSDIDMAARTAIQVARIERGTSKETISTYRKVAAKVAPRVASLLSGPDGERRLLTAIIVELQDAGVPFSNKARRGKDTKDGNSKLEDLGSGKEADSLRGEAQDIETSASAAANAAAAAIAVAAAAVSTVPIVGQIIAAIAAIIMIIEYIEQTEKEQAAAGERKAENTESDAEVAARLRRLKARLVSQAELYRDDELFAK